MAIPSLTSAVRTGFCTPRRGRSRSSARRIADRAAATVALGITFAAFPGLVPAPVGAAAAREGETAGLVAGAAASFVAEVVVSGGAPVVDAVVALVPLASSVGRRGAAGEPARATMDQVDLAFVPHVLAVETGTQVDFPNSDQVRHSIYSFSPARTFETRLYRGYEAPPITFDRAGLVVLGCNIHDHMLAFIYVLETPWSGVSDERGRVAIEDVPPGRYRLELRHPRLDEGLVVAREIALPAERAVTVELPAKPPPRPTLQPALDPLQQLFDGVGR